MRIVGALGMALAGLSVIGAVTAYGQIDTRSQYGGPAASVVDNKGNLRVPADYQTAYQFLGTWAVAADDGPGAKEMHVVYASPGTIAAYRKDGHFPDGTVLVKEDNRNRKQCRHPRWLVRHGEKTTSADFQETSFGQRLGLVLVRRN